MATPSVRTGPGGTSSTASPTPSRARDWSTLRSGEPGSAFRGMTKGRGDTRGRGRGGGGGGGGGRGGRGGRQGSGSSRRDQASPPKPDASPKTSSGPATSSVTAPSTPSAVKTPASGSNGEKLPRLKPPSRKASRNIPALVIAPSSPTVESAPPSVSSHPSNRKRRSQQHGRSPQSPTPQKSGLSESSPSQTLLRPRQVRTGPPTPITPSKDASPHLSAAPNVSAFDVHDIDAFVERVRAAASNRPSTPGSHIDWAGDDDDSLPDLDDWGVTTTTTSIVVSEADRNEISPILGDNLKPLPETSTQASAGNVECKNTDVTDTQPDISVLVAQNDKARPNGAALPPKALSPDEEAPIAVNSSDTSSPTSKTFSSLEPITRTLLSNSSKTLIHPSLPAKPVAAVESLASQALSSKSRNGAALMRVSLPVRRSPVFEKPVEMPLATADDTAEKHALPVPAVETQTAEAPKFDEPTVIEAPAVEASSQAPSDPISTTGSIPENSPPANDTPEKETPGLYESVHAPSLTVTSFPNLPQSTPNAPRNFNPTHHRAHTAGRLNGFSQPNTFQQRFSRSGASSPRGGFNGYHNRTQSSPPASLGVHAHRPVITGDALSRLARSIGGPSLRGKEVTTATES